MPNLNPELMMVPAAIGNPVQLLGAVPAGILAVSSAAKSFTIVHQSEMGVLTRRGAPMLKPEIHDRVMHEICDDLPDRRIRCVSELVLLPKDERRERMEEKIRELPDEVTEKGIYRVVGRGIVWLRPFVDHVPKINVADQTTPLDPFEIESNEDTQMIITPSVTWNVRSDGDNPYKAIYNINNEKDSRLKNKTEELEQTIAWICNEGLGLVLRGRTYEQLKNFDRDEITKETQKLCTADMLRYGTQIVAVRLKPIVRSAAERVSQAIESNPDSRNVGIIAASTALGEAGRIALRAVPPPEEIA